MPEGFHTMQKTEAHIYISHQCRQILQSRPPSDHIAPGAGSSIDRAMTAEPDRLPLNQVPRLRADPNIDDGLFVYLTDQIYPGMCLEDPVKLFATDHPISWTMWTRTLSFFGDFVDEEDAEFAGLSLPDMMALERLRDPVTLPFLNPGVSHDRASPIAQTTQLWPSLCASSCTPGRCRPGDLQYFLEKVYEQSDVDVSWILSSVEPMEMSGMLGPGSTVSMRSKTAK